MLKVAKGTRETAKRGTQWSINCHAALCSSLHRHHLRQQCVSAAGLPSTIPRCGVRILHVTVSEAGGGGAPVAEERDGQAQREEHGEDDQCEEPARAGECQGAGRVAG